ncbi:hypothetical protein H2200_013032 [Cladophialophora chaetospira]|uniref:Azaphilone pigments biosynthesis cluster protein L N-terminal domain-containing protein n=1 Tax=Cladophialophora chaetospira TaxID=386627 RepID=A0AA38WWM5_9EURO|nr:hypothetical protein H2200_013032 [Cladophialophora chaetospira]
MDPISAGASVLAFVVLALDGTKSLYQLIIGFKRATRETRAIAVAINDLQNVLRHFETSPVLNSPATELNDMVRVLSACHQDLTRFRQSIKEYQLASKVSKCRRVLQTVKSPFAKSELDFIRQSICDYHGALQIRLSIVNSSVLQTCKDEIHGLHNRAAANDLKTSTILDSVENITTSVRAHTEGIRKVQDTATAGVQQASSLIKDVQSMRSSVEYQMRNMSITSASAIDRHAAYSASRLEDILTAFRTLQEQFTSLPDQVASAQAKLTPLQGLAPPCSSSGQATNEDLELRHSLERLQRLSSSITRTLFDEEAKRIVDDLGRVLRALAKFGNEGLSSQSQQLTHVDSNDSITASEIDEVRSLVSLAGGVAINQGRESSPLLAAVIKD